MRRGCNHFWQAPTALDLPPGGGGGQLKRHPPTHRLTNTNENIKDKIFRRVGILLPFGRIMPPESDAPYQKVGLMCLLIRKGCKQVLEDLGWRPGTDTSSSPAGT